MRMLLSADWLMGDTECQSHIFYEHLPCASLSHFRDEKTEAQQCEMTA